MITILSIAVVLRFLATGLNWILFPAATQWGMRKNMFILPSAEMIVSLLISWVAVMLNLRWIFVFGRLQQFLDIYKLPLPKILNLPPVPLLLGIINKFPEFYLQPVHSLISLLYFVQWLFLVGFDKNLDNLFHLIGFFLILAHLVLLQHPQIVLDAVAQKYPVVFEQF